MKPSSAKSKLSSNTSHHISCFVAMSYTIMRRSVSLELPVPVDVAGRVPPDACVSMACARVVDGFSLRAEDASLPIATSRVFSGVIARSCIRMSDIGQVEYMLPSRF
jgi:hypothetical protein